ncbi:AraC family transcriptional regulator [Paenibacillus sp. DYY-L-2]|uniref:AraC family transcriptional regulator n=1 Tax=Paenibacillus sp. DYY-L-2 TaxID=3447013 RepID=UPI003F4F8FFA
MIEILHGAKETVAYREHFGIRLYLNQEAEDYPIHWHTAAEIIMPIENIYTAVVDDIKYVLQPGDIFVIPSGELHRLFAPESGKRMILQFDCSTLYNIDGFNSTFHLLRPCLHITSGQNPKLHQSLRPLLLELMEEYFSKSLLREASSYSLLIRFLVVLGRNFMNEKRHSPRDEGVKKLKYIDKLIQVCNYMNEHCTEDIQVEELADLAGFSKFHFMRLFKQFMGMSYYSYLNQHRIMHAEKLLIDPNLSVMEVAMSSGFGSLATFNRVFKNYKKCTPSEYKALHGNHALR